LAHGSVASYCIVVRKGNYVEVSSGRLTEDVQVIGFRIMVIVGTWCVEM
jgi:hypothetical protein